MSDAANVTASSAAAANDDNHSASRVWECTVCGFVYNQVLGLPLEGIEPGTAWDDIPDDWCCPDCGVSKADFDMIEM